jgi:superfamily II DNA/RNA helicase
MEEKEDELLTKLILLKETDPTIEICTPSDFLPNFVDGLKRDLKILTELNEDWKTVEQDPKIDEFVRRLNTELLQKTINPEQKLVVFSESKETTNHISKYLKDAGRKDVLEIHSDNRNKLKQVIRENFDANIPRKDYKSDYNIIIATEVLAEGVNLHRSNVIVNYDTPWNSTRLMQRIGRVNRIGSMAPKVHIYNFYPTAKVNDDIELEKKAIMKLQAFHSALGEDSEIYSPDEETQSFGLFDQDVDEDKDERLAYLMELRKFKAESPELFRRIKNMPLRARVGRDSRTLKGTSICFMRNERRDAFYFIRPDNSIEELSFIETAKEFNANVPEKGLPLPETHHEQINVALDDFNEKIQTEMASAQVVDTTQGPNEKRALAYMDGFLSFPFASDEEKQLIKAAKQAVKLGKFQKLQREVNKLKKNAKAAPLKATDLMDALLKIINNYPVLQADTLDQRPAITIKSFEKLKPEIIISESFTHKK